MRVHVVFSRSLMCLGILLFPSFFMFAQAQSRSEEMPLPHLRSRLDFARLHNLELAAMRLETGAADERIVVAGSLADPRLRLELQDVSRMDGRGVGLFPTRVGSVKYTLMQELPWPGKRELKTQIARADAHAMSARADIAWQELAAQVKLVHAQWYRTLRQIEVARSTLSVMADLEKIAQFRYAHGLAQQQDVIRAQLEQTTMRNELLMRESEASQLRIKTNTLLGRSINAPLAEPEDLPALPALSKLDATVLLQRANAKSPQLFVEDARIVSAQKSRELTAKNNYPDITVGVSPIQAQGSVREWELMFEVNLPFQQSARRSLERESEALLAAARARKTGLQNQLGGELAEHVAGLESARQIEMQLSQRLLPQAELSLASAISGYENGKLDFATLLEAQLQIRNARKTHIEAQVEAYVHVVAIEKLLGEEL